MFNKKKLKKNCNHEYRIFHFKRFHSKAFISNEGSTLEKAYFASMREHKRIHISKSRLKRKRNGSSKLHDKPESFHYEGSSTKSSFSVNFDHLHT